MTARFDTVVVGGGPAGSTVAWQLARAGQRVVVLDAARFPRVKLCAGWVTRAVLSDLALPAADYPHTIEAFARVSLAVGLDEHETCWPAVASYGIVRAEFDAFLLERAAAVGVDVRQGVRVRGVRVGGVGVEVETDVGTIGGDLLVGAGGSACPVARALGDVASGEAVVVTQESETRIGRSRLGKLAPRCGAPELFAEPDFRGYGWYFTKGDFLNIGVGAVGGLPVRRRLEHLLARLHATRRLAADVVLAPFRGHAYVVRRGRPRRIAGPRFALVGDAAGLARDVSGEGIGPAVRSALLAAASIAGARPADYAARIDAEYGRPGGVRARLTRYAPSAALAGLAYLVCTRPRLRRRFVLEGAFGMG